MVTCFLDTPFGTPLVGGDILGGVSVTCDRLQCPRSLLNNRRADRSLEIHTGGWRNEHLFMGPQALHLHCAPMVFCSNYGELAWQVLKGQDLIP